MADYVVTVANVIAGGNARTKQGTAGVAITAGQVLCQNTDFTMHLADANLAAPLNTVAGVALHAALPGQPIVYAVADPQFQPGFSFLGVGDAAILSHVVAGNMCPDADKATGDYVTELGRAISLTKMNLNIVAVGVVR